MQTTTAASPLLPSNRVLSIDLLRGLVMIIMALDHTRDFFHSEAMVDDPLNLATTTPALFFTRWITHFCAPIFVFLSGTSAFLQAARKPKKELSRFLITRGLWLIIAEIVLVNLIFSFDPFYTLIGLQVIWAIGISMLLLGLLIWLPFPVLLIIGLVIVLGHNGLDFYEKENEGPYPAWYNLLHHFGFHPLWAKHNLLILYPFLPWTGLMILGYCLGKVIRDPDAKYRKKFLITTGFSVIALFVVVRFINVYGDPDLWSNQSSDLYTFLSFLNTHKYPPSLLYMCMTIGPALLFIAFFENVQNGLTKIISVYGRVPFFYYLLHFLVIHIFSTLMFFLNGHSFKEGIGIQNSFANFLVPGEGLSLGWTYVVWIAIVAGLYPLCRWYDQYKQRNKHIRWLSYL